MEWLINTFEWLIKTSINTGKWLKELAIDKLLLKELVKIFLLISVLTGLLVFYLTGPVPTYIQIDLTVSQISFLINDNSLEFKPIKFYAVNIGNFTHLKFSPESITDEHQKNIEIDRASVSIIAKDEILKPAVYIETITPDDRQFGNLHQLSVTPGSKITLKISGEDRIRKLSINIENYQTNMAPSAIFRHQGIFKVETLYCNFDGTRLPICQTDFCNFQVNELSDKNPSLEISGQTHSLNFVLTFPSLKSFDIFPKGVSMTAPDFEQEKIVKGKRDSETTLIENGEFSYPEYPKFDPIQIAASTFVNLGKNNKFRVERVTFNSESNGINVRLSGLAKEKITTYCYRTDGKKVKKEEDYRLTKADTFGRFGRMMTESLKWIITVVLTILCVVRIGGKND